MAATGHYVEITAQAKPPGNRVPCLSTGSCTGKEGPAREAESNEFDQTKSQARHARRRRNVSSSWNGLSLQHTSNWRPGARQVPRVTRPLEVAMQPSAFYFHIEKDGGPRGVALYD